MHCGRLSNMQGYSTSPGNSAPSPVTDNGMIQTLCHFNQCAHDTIHAADTCGVTSQLAGGQRYSRMKTAAGVPLLAVLLGGSSTSVLPACRSASVPGDAIPLRRLLLLLLLASVESVPAVLLLAGLPSIGQQGGLGPAVMPVLLCS